VSPRYNLLHGTPHIIPWTDERKWAFLELCAKYTAPITIHHANSTGQFLLSIDVSILGIGSLFFKAELSKKELKKYIEQTQQMCNSKETRCIAGYLRFMSDPKSRELTIERGLLSVVDSLEDFKTVIHKLNSLF
jgi:hypothetical protein